MLEAFQHVVDIEALAYRWSWDEANERGDYGLNGQDLKDFLDTQDEVADDFAAEADLRFAIMRVNEGQW